MEYEKLDEKAPVQAPKQVSQKDYRENAGIKNARTVILVLLSIQLVCNFLFLLKEIHHRLFI